VEKSWVNCERKQITDPKAFIYSLVNKENKPFKVMCSEKATNAIYCHSISGPIFGGRDIYIASGSNSNQDSCCNFGSTYIHPEYQKGTPRAQNILAGSFNFQTIDIEVFTNEN